jgi:hypothetical protein
MGGFRILAKLFCFTAYVFSLASPASAKLREINLFGGASFTIYAPTPIQVPTFPPGSGFVFSLGGATPVPVAYPSAGLGGFHASFEAKPLRLLGIVADFSESFGTETAGAECVLATPHLPYVCSVKKDRIDLYTLLAGPQASFGEGKFTIFAHGLVGDGYVTAPLEKQSEGRFAAALGGGVDYQLIPRMALRLQADALKTTFSAPRFLQTNPVFVGNFPSFVSVRRGQVNFGASIGLVFHLLKP